ncbi:MAG: glycosyltransferase [bacterium]|nr:glycosyltransferase [bacterium]
MTICYFGSYDKNYPRNRTIIKGLIKNGDRIIECHSPKSIIFGRWIILFIKFLKIKCDLIIVGFPGHTDIFFAWILAKIFSKRLVFDAFISLYDSRCFDRKDFSPYSWHGRVLWLVDKISCTLSDKVLLDTKTHINYFSQEFRIPIKKFIKVFVGTDEDLFVPKAHITKKPFEIGFHGSYLPAQGIEYVLKAAELLKDEPVVFSLVGSGQEFAKGQNIVNKLGLSNVKFLPKIPYEELPDFISQCDIYLGGHFGVTPKAFRVIPNKVFEAIAMRKPVIIGKSLATEELFTDNKDCLMVKHGNSRSLAGAVKLLVRDQKLRRKISENAFGLFQKELTSFKIVKEFKNDLAK